VESIYFSHDDGAAPTCAGILETRTSNNCKKSICLFK